jgi:PhzF family phenazine biosynthesis protein
VTAFAYRLVNVFAEDTLAGNALCVFEDARGLNDDAMQALARQFNLSETTFLLPSERANARVRIFTPFMELPFAGHPTLGSAAVVRALRGADTQVTLEMTAGLIPVTAQDDRYTLTAGAPRWHPVEASRETLSTMLGIASSAIDAPVLWVSTGNPQLLVPLRAPEDVERCKPDPQRAAQFANEQGSVQIYVWAQRTGDTAVARFFFGAPGAPLMEDPGTGSACANLGAWMLAAEHPLPVRLTVQQGDHLGRPCRLQLDVDMQRRIRVGGRVVELGRGLVHL